MWYINILLLIIIIKKKFFKWINDKKKIWQSHNLSVSTIYNMEVAR